MYWGTSRFRGIREACLLGPGRRELILRSGGRVVFIPLSGWRQYALIAVIGAFGAWVGHASFSYFDQQRVIEGKNLELVRAGEHSQALLAKMSEMRSQFSDVAGTLEHNQRDLANLLKQNHALRQEFGDVEQSLHKSRTRREAGDRKRHNLSAKLAGLKSEMQKMDTRNRFLVGNLNVTRTKLIDSIAGRSRVDSTRRTLEDRVKGLERRLARVRGSQKNLLNRVTAKAVHDLKRAERVIARIGLNIKKLMKRADGNAYAQGGPFIPAEGFADGVAIFDRHMARLKEIQGVLRRLPLAAPLGRYRIASRFGRRRDPINKKWARHEGVDLSGKLRSPVMAPAPGKVIFAGWKGRYGRLVTIDHGLGIRTRYGHLRRIQVKRGQKVRFGEMIGQLGNSGRSTGAHLHYEILIDGKPVNPAKFMKAGKDVFKG